jgi:integrase/recombinase XerD
MSCRPTFAGTCLPRWYQQGVAVQALLPHLSVYLGPVHPHERSWYLTAVPELLGAAAPRFPAYAHAGGDSAA